MKNDLKGSSRRGSALLIVLGFLSFMMISAVSFAIYMRIERQASSNYRHATTARHLLNSALYRAIDEIDGELRIEKLKAAGPYQERDWNGKAVTTSRPVKFPEWPGHVKPSAVVNESGNIQDARVLSMEALSFIPGVFVNDVRRYAVTNRFDYVDPKDKGKPSYFGTKWRTLSMPVHSIVGGENAYEEAVVGRYAYLCVNVSDMLDVNVCKAGLRDTVTNRVSIGHLFGQNAQAAQDAFDTYVEGTARRFETLQDFYACMFQKQDLTFGSPYHEYITSLDPNNPDIAFDNAVNHVLITDGLAKAQPASKTACNITLQQPIAQVNLGAPQKPSVPLDNTRFMGRDGFQDALTKTFTVDRRPPTMSPADFNNYLNVMAFMMADYIDEDNVPKALHVPSVELVPMVSQILVSPLFAPRIMEEVGPAVPPAKPIKTFWLNAVPVGGQASVFVEVVWPYKRLKGRTAPLSSAYEIEVQAYLKIHSVPKDSSGFKLSPTSSTGYLKLSSQNPVPVPDFSSKNDDNQNECYKAVMVPLVAPTPRLDFVKSDNTPLIAGGDYVPGDPLMVSLIVFTRVRLKGGLYVDSVPQTLPIPPSSNADTDFVTALNKLYFQSDPIPFDPTTVSIPGSGLPITFAWNSLEVPDPRFNHKTANWISSAKAGAGIPPNDINPSTTQLLGKDGRDGDIFMSVSNAGKLISPGELGFLLRPFKFDLNTTAVDFRTHTKVDPAKDDSDAYFRTIRLYDHSNTTDPTTDKVKLAADPVYQYFTAQNADGTVAGARVNPLSDIPLVLSAAIEQTPTDYWYASRDVNADKTIKKNNTFNQFLSSSDWSKFTNAWASCFLNIPKVAAWPTPAGQPQRPAGSELRGNWKFGLPDYYGRLDTFGWYSEGDPLTVFKPQGFTPKGVPASLGTSLHEIDRKMLFSFSLDAFSDRQQLFLYILRAEVTNPSFGGSQSSDVKSLAGGRAVALVWRDPYPEDYDKETDNWLEKGTAYWYKTNKRVSPWFQVNTKKNNTDFEENDLGGDPSLQGVKSKDGRFDGYHQHRILYFKQLDE